MIRDFAQFVVGGLAANPWTFDALRYALEAGYRGERAAIDTHLRRDASILDVGCGTGSLAHCFDSTNYLGVEISPRYVTHARRRHPRHSFKVMDATQLQLGDASFDQVLVAGVLHHCDDSVARQIVSEISRVLSADGVALIFEDVPARSRWNLAGRLIHTLDEGDFIREEDGYSTLFAGQLETVERFPMQSGVCDYACWLLKKTSA